MIWAGISELLILWVDGLPMMRTSHLSTWGTRALGVVIFVVMIAAVTWSLLGRSEMLKNDELLLNEANSARDLLVHDLSVRIAILQRIGRRLGGNATFETAQFRNEALSYLADIPGFYAMAWVGEDDRVAFSEPAMVKSFIGNHLRDLGSGWAELAAKVREGSGPIIGPVITINENGDRGFITALKVRHAGKPDGILWVITHAEYWVENLFYGSAIGAFDNLAVSVSLNGETIYENEQYSEISEPGVGSRVERLVNSEFMIVVKPKAEFLAKENLGLPKIFTLLVSILSFATLIAVLALRDLRTQQRRIATVNGRLRRTNRRMYREIAHRRDAEEDAKRSNATKTQFLSTMSHEFRTPVNGVVGMAELLADSNLSEPQASQVENIRQSGKALMDIISDFLDFSKFEAGEIELRPQPSNVQDIVSEAVSLFQPMAEKKGLTLSFETALGAQRFLQLDPSRYRQIVLNLVRNAVKFTDEGFVSVQLATEENNSIPILALTVKDSGVGIPREKLDGIFGPFQQVDGAASRKFDGTGLGLSIVQRLAQAMGGDVAVTSGLHEGSTFTVSIPAVAAPHPKAVAPRDEGLKQTSHISNAKILLAEDNAINQRIVAGYLKGTGVSLDLAIDGEEAVDRYKAGAYDAILMDISMPRMNGFDATQRIREIERADQRPICPILGYTANFGEEDQKKCRSCGMDDVLGKPVSKSELISRLVHWIEEAKSTDAPRPAPVSAQA